MSLMEDCFENCSQHLRNVIFNVRDNWITKKDNFCNKHKANYVVFMEDRHRRRNLTGDNILYISSYDTLAKVKRIHLGVDKSKYFVYDKEGKEVVL